MKKLCSLFLAGAALALAGCAAAPMHGEAPMVRSMPVAAPATAGKTEVLWLGQATTRITTPGGKVIVIDPWLTTNPKTPAGYKRLEALGKVDLILVTHAHFDHFADAAALAKMNNAPIYNAGGMGQAIVTLGIVPAALAPRFGKSGTIQPFGPNGVKITAVHAEHSSELVWKNPATGKDETHFGGEPVGYILETENGFRLWHMGDTGLFGDMRLIGELYKPDLVMIPIGLATANELGVSALPMMLAVAMGASASFLTPFANGVSLMVYGPGGYRFGDFWRLGLVVMAWTLIVSVVVIPLVWHF